MDNVDELLDEALDETSTRNYLTIDPLNRTINTGTRLLLGVESDEKAERVWFKCPRIVGDNLDLSTLHIYINYENANKFRTPYLVEDVTVDGDDIIFSWKLHKEVTLYKGTVSFIVCAKKSDADGDLANEWNTTLATGTVLTGLEATEQVVEQSYDVIEQILVKLDNINASIGEAVSTYLEENPIEAGATTEQAAQIEQNKKDISSINTNLTDYAKKTEIPEVPTKLPNPYTLTFTGAAEGTYDGSAAKTINIPNGGGVDVEYDEAQGMLIFDELDGSGGGSSGSSATAIKLIDETLTESATFSHSLGDTSYKRYFLVMCLAIDTEETRTQLNVANIKLKGLTLGYYLGATNPTNAGYVFTSDIEALSDGFKIQSVKTADSNVMTSERIANSILGFDGVNGNGNGTIKQTYVPSSSLNGNDLVINTALTKGSRIQLWAWK